MAGCDAIAMSNEHSASAPNLQIDDTEVNHQYSKSLEFEEDFSEYVRNCISPSIAYFSLLRPLSEIEIARRFAKYREYFRIFCSCNTAFRQSRSARGRRLVRQLPEMPVRVSGALAVHHQSRADRDFRRQPSERRAQRDGFAELCGLQEYKPFECVGEAAESAAVMSYLAKSARMAGRCRGQAAARATSLRCDSEMLPSTARCSRSSTLIGFRNSIWRCSMRAADLGARRVAIWGLGREGRAAIGFLRKHHPSLPLVLMDDDSRCARSGGASAAMSVAPLVPTGSRAVLDEIEVVVKSPGVSLYRDEIRSARESGVRSRPC